MKTFALSMALVAIGSSTFVMQGVLQAGEPKPKVTQNVSDDEIAKLIGELGSPSYKTRVLATHKLEKLGRLPKAQLEKAAQSPDLEVAVRAGTLLQAIKLDEAWDLEEFQIKIEKRKASEIFSELSGKLDRKIKFGFVEAAFVRAEAEDPVIDFSYKGLSYWKALDSLCSKSKNELIARPWARGHKQAVVKASGWGPAAVAYNHAFRLSVPRDFDRSEDAMTFWVSLSADNRVWLAGCGEKLEVVEATTDKGEKLKPVPVPNQAHSASVPLHAQSCHDVKLHLPFPKEKAKSMKKLRVKLRVEIYTDTTTVEISNLDNRNVQKLGGLGLLLNNLTENAEGELELSLQIGEGRKLVHGSPKFELLDTKGKALELLRCEAWETPACHDFVMQFTKSANPPAKLMVSYAKLVAARDLEFDLDGMLLPDPNDGRWNGFND